MHGFNQTTRAAQMEMEAGVWGKKSAQEGEGEAFQCVYVRTQLW